MDELLEAIKGEKSGERTGELVKEYVMGLVG